MKSRYVLIKYCSQLNSAVKLKQRLVKVDQKTPLTAGRQVKQWRTKPKATSFFLLGSNKVICIIHFTLGKKKKPQNTKPFKTNT